MRKPSFLAEGAVLLGLGLLAFLVIGQWLGTARRMASGADTTAACAANLHRLQAAFTRYAQDNDENFPPMGNAQEFQAALMPYVGDASVFRCPDTGLPYTPNAALSRGTYPPYTTDVDVIEVVRDSAPHGDGQATVVFLDGHVEHGGVEYGDATAIITEREKAVAIAIIEYTEDADETYPPMHTLDELQTAVYPFTHSHRIFYSPTGQPFVPNAALSGVFLSAVPDPIHTILIQDTAPYVDGAPTIAYADGHLERGGIEFGDPNVTTTSRAKQLFIAIVQYTQDYDEVYPPMGNVSEFQAALAPYTRSLKPLSNTRGQPFVPNAALSGVSLASITDPATTVLFQDTPPYADGSPTTAYADGHVTHTVLPPHTHLLWNNTDGRVMLWSVAGDGSFTLNGFGPYTDGAPQNVWHATAVATGADGLSHLLWNNTDGRVMLWTVDDSGGFTYAGYGPYTDGAPQNKWSATAVSVGPDNVVHLLWNNTDHRVMLWNVAQDFSFTLAGFGPYTDNSVNGSPGNLWSAVALATGPDNESHIAWNNVDGRVMLWNVNPAFQFGVTGYGPYTDSFVSNSPANVWSAQAVSVGSDEKIHLVWGNADRRMMIWNLDGLGAFTLAGFGPYNDNGANNLWSVTSVATGPDGLSRILWGNTDDRAMLWSMDGAFNFTVSGYGPYTDNGPGDLWSATAVSAGP